jgi:hypothetical protein
LQEAELMFAGPPSFAGGEVVHEEHGQHPHGRPE